ncbi:SDR family NAD(P)-dependent oxidoreductase [Halosimplex pelagicum]|uniref:SDR family oxidoreductase n=1 Tax=Halosimplex pelagicum TaxID=869886 RepID=A0A7D5P4K4_9EURY|nr:SDR family NAD(P)-dependent oxidoreductase [Halosimplex pelagicum]QLH80706.1 SDR family oxidoreductase [Halosimplex pelagicum]
MDLDLTGQTALVTGGGRGNGRAIALELAEHGADVIVNDLDEDVAKDTAATIRDRDDDSDAVGVAADVTDEAEVQAMVEHGVEELGSVDILVNNAGVGNAGPFLDEDYDDDFRLNIEVHLFGSINCTRAVVDGMVEDGYGKIINITSIHTKNAVGQSPQYDVGKWSLLGLTKSLALELGHEGIRVNAVAPGWVNTRMTEGFSEAVTEQIQDLNPLGQFAEPEDIANGVTFLASPAADYVNGHELRVDGGQVPIPDWRLDNR